MRLHRFYVLQPLGEEVVIDDVSLINQWTKVFRYKEGDFVILFNGEGEDCHYSLSLISKTVCSLTRTKHVTSYIPKQKITLCLSVIKKDNFELATQKATELGISSIQPILSARSEKKGLSHERLEKIAIEASEQCGRGDVPTIQEIRSLEECLKSLPEEHLGIIFTIEGEPITDSKKITQDKEVFLFIGPEGGWSEEDITLMKQYRLQEYSLGKTMLRAETAAIVATAFVTI